MVKDLITTVSHQKAEIGLFVTLTKPTKPMIKTAVTEGFYESPIGKSFPKIQILTIEELLDGTNSPKYPNLDAGGLTFKKAKKEEKEQHQHELL